MPQVIKKVTKRKGSAPITQTVIVNVSKGRRGGRAVPKAKAQGQPASANVGQSIGSEYAQLTGVPYLGHVAGRFPGMVGGFNQPLHIVSEKEALEQSRISLEKQVDELKKKQEFFLGQKPLMVDMGIQAKPLMVDTSIQAKPLMVDTSIQAKPIMVDMGIQQKPLMADIGIQQKPLMVDQSIQVIKDIPISTKSISIGTDLPMMQKPLTVEMGVQAKPLMVEMGIQEKPLITLPKKPTAKSFNPNMDVAEPNVAALPAVQSSANLVQESLPAVVREVMPEQAVYDIERVLIRIKDIPIKIAGKGFKKDLVHLVRAVNRKQKGDNKFVRKYGEIENGSKDNFLEYLRSLPGDTAREYNNLGF